MNSCLLPPVSGDPRGTVLGPLLFLYFTADLTDIVKNKTLSMFDDTRLPIPSKKI